MSEALPVKNSCSKDIREMWDIMWDHLDKSNVQFNGIIYTSEIKAQYKIISKPIKKPSKKRSHSLLHDLVTILFFDCIIVLGK